MVKTGGGRNAAPSVSGTNQQVLALLGKTVKPLQNVYDSANLYHDGKLLQYKSTFHV